MDFLTTEHAHELMWAVLKGKPYTRVVNILNDGFIAGLPPTPASKSTSPSPATATKANA